ncbi:MAG: rhodanese-like domain-containing protein [Paracoccaceae bacterium]|tara:strand:- start:154 stop:558 length:405 start_codon:yes stop_codon:yes gene_type:complete
MKKLGFSIFIYLISTMASAEVFEIGNNQLRSLIENQVPIIDIRRQEEWNQTGIVKDSILMTFFNKNGKADTENWLKNLDLVAKKNEPFILICRTGRRTSLVAKFLSEKLNYEKVYDVTDGITEWIKKGNTVVKP